MERRDFMHVCAASALGLGTAQSLAMADAQPRQYARPRLTDESGQTLRASHLTAGENYVFHYPFEGTPCFLINLGKATQRSVPLKTGDGASYQWPGGVGPQRAIVA